MPLSLLYIVICDLTSPDERDVTPCLMWSPGDLELGEVRPGLARGDGLRRGDCNQHQISAEQ